MRTLVTVKGLAVRLGLVAASLAASVVLAGCGSSSKPAASTSAPAATTPSTGLHGLVPTPFPVKPSFTLTDTSGKAYSFGKATHGKLTYLFFGYTHCPDACPATMSYLAYALRQQPASVRRQVAVVFVTVDPKRDSGPVIRRWLDHFDVTFVGLTGTQAQIAEAERAAKVPEAVLQPPSANGKYTVGHASQVIAYTLDDEAHLVYPFGIRQTDWARDLPKLLTTTDWPA